MTTDYLKIELRQQVEELKASAAAESTTAANAEARARIVWQWLNAAALAGQHAPPDLPLVCGMLLSRGAADTYHAGPYSIFDRYVRELTLRDEQPGAIGTLSTATTGPFVIQSHQTIEQTYTVGEMSMRPGGSINLTWEFHSDIAPLQTADPAAESYVTVACSNPRARFVPATWRVGGIHGGFFSEVERPAFRLEGCELRKGDRITITYGDRNGGGPGLRLQSYAVDRFVLPVYLDLEGDGESLSLPLLGWPLLGKDAHALRVVAPSVVKTGEPLTLAICVEDEHYHPASGTIPGFRVTLDGETVATLPAGEQPILTAADLRLDKPGVYRFTVESEDGRFQALSNPVWAQAEPAQRIYWGDMHGHSEMADAQGSAEGYLPYARDIARLDYAVHSEHDMWMDDREWKTLAEQVRQHSEAGRFIAFLGYEWTVKASRGGHHNVYFRTPEDRLRVPIQQTPVLSEFYQRLAVENDPRDVLIAAHAHEPGDYRMTEPRMERLVEVMSLHGHHEWLGRAYLEHGHEIGFIAGSDDHTAHAGRSSFISGNGLGAVFASELTPDALFDALRNRQTYATTGERMILDWQLNDGRPGERIAYADERRIRGRVHGTAPIEQIDVIKNGCLIHSESCDVPPDSPWFELRMFSDSDPGVFDSPRGGRPWKGRLRVAGATVAEVATPSFNSPRQEWLRPVTDSELEFQLVTRGDTEAIRLRLTDIEPGAKIEVQLDAAREGTTTPATFRACAELPAESFTLPLRHGAEQHLPVDQYTDRVSLHQVNPEAPRDRKFSFTDTDTPRQGDTYYVRVRQLDGGTAWSSPVWVGGFGSQ